MSLILFICTSSSHVGSGIVDGVGQISYGHCLHHASPFCSIPCILFHQSIFYLILYVFFLRLFRSFSSFTTLTSNFKAFTITFSSFFSKHDRTTAYYLLKPSYLKTPLCPTCPSTPRCFFDLIVSPHTSLKLSLFLFFSKLPSLSSQAPCFTSIQDTT